MNNPIRRLVPALLLAALFHPTAEARGQVQPTNPAQVEVGRGELERLLAQYEETAASSAYSRGLRERARTDADLIRQRLDAGDFMIGDQIALVVEGEPDLSGDFVVQAGPSLVLPVIGTISLSGVLRSELESYLRGELGTYLREPAVHARASIRVMVTGGVGRAGYYVMPTSTVFSDALMVAGGPSNDAKLQDIRVERANRVIWSGDAMQQAIIEGRTLDQLSIQAGDHIFVPARSQDGAFGRIVRTTTAIVAPIAMLTVTLLQVF